MWDIQGLYNLIKVQFFLSGIFQQVMHELGIKQYKSTAYHPESQGALERFHQTLKNMIRSYCFDTEKDWDEGIHLLLFAVRESVKSLLGSVHLNWYLGILCTDP